MNIRTVLAHRRDGVAHSPEEIAFLVKGATGGTIADYQLSAWLMAACLKPLSTVETAALTREMAASGKRLDLTGLPRPWLDKHSTGGVGDKTSLVLLPLLASCGLTVVKMSGRGLGITGGTVDKLGSVPGFRMDLSPAEMIEQARRIGIAVTGQTADLAPADKVLYALRDATETVESMPLIVSSILSKKIAGGAEIVVLDVKCGSGAFMRTLEAAQELARSLCSIGSRCGLQVRASISDMDQPLGCTVGNALEVREALEVLSNSRDVRSERFRALCVDLGGHALEAAGKVSGEEEGRAVAEKALTSGAALNKAREWFAAQGAALDPDVLPKAPVVLTATADRTGTIERIDAGIVGEAVVDLGGGRRRKEDSIAPSVGLEFHCEVGSQPAAGEPVFTVHASSDESARAAQDCVKAAFRWTAGDVPRRPALIERVAE